MSETTHNARRVSVRVSVNGHDATDYMLPSLLDFSYTDNLSGKADEVQISLQDREARWNGPWKPQKGMKVEASLTVKDWFAPGEDSTLPCGSFKIDEITLDGPPDVFKIKAVSASLTSGLREEAKTRAWENQSLKGVAGQIAQEHGLELQYVGEDAPLSRQDQREEADLPFVNRLAHERAMHCKVHDNKLILDDSIKAEQKKTSLTLSRVGGDCPVTRYSFKQSSASTDYTKTEVAYTDPSTGKVHTATATVPPPPEMVGPPEEKVLQQNVRVESSGEAMRIGGAALHNANKSTNTASVDCMGHPGLVAGLTVNLAGFGDFSGAYLIEKATHKVGGSGGYTTALELRKCRLAPDVRMSSGSRAVAQNVPLKVSPPRPKRDPPANNTEKWATLFDLRRQFWLASGVDKLTGLLLCLPKIAQSMGGKADNTRDAQGWLYLESMFHHWFSEKGDKDGEPFWVDWQWIMQYARAREYYQLFIRPTLPIIPTPDSGDDPHPNITNWGAAQQLGKIVTRQAECKALAKGEHWDFDFISSPWPQWEDKYHTLIAVPRGEDADGLMASMAGFSLRALAKGRVKFEGGQEYWIHISAVAVFAHDKFQFEKEQVAYLEQLGWWSCEELHGGVLQKPEVNSSSYFSLENETFRTFRRKYEHGGDFLVLSQPHLVENFKGVSYVYSCK